LHDLYLHHRIQPKKQANGRSSPVPRDSEEFKRFKTRRAAKIHGTYEETLLEIDPATALAGVDQA
jgi:hypothetical protein